MPILYYYMKYHKHLIWGSVLNLLNDKNFHMICQVNLEFNNTSLTSSSALVDSSSKANWGFESKRRANARRCCSPRERTLDHSCIESKLKRANKYPRRTSSKTFISSSVVGFIGLSFALSEFGKFVKKGSASADQFLTLNEQSLHNIQPNY